jgi:hypothetical protein
MFSARGKEKTFMNDLTRTSPGTLRHPGRGLLLLGVLIALAGPAIYFVQLGAKVLVTPWYEPILATLGLALIAMALMRSRSVWRWLAAAFFALFATGQWLLLLVLMNTPAYTGPVKSGQSFPAFATTLADGSPFTDADLKGDQSTVMVFFRGHW